jgi:uncharacterized protein YgbK (DUF1537 family)
MSVREDEWPEAVVEVSRLDALPAARHELAEVRRLHDATARKIVVLDDDPTGTQTVHGIDVLTGWSEPALTAALLDPRSCFYLLTNSRSLPEADAVSLARTLMDNLRAASLATGRETTIISRSDSTLRGHFAAEIDVLSATALAPYDGVIVAPAFFEVGRVTLGDVHYVREGDRLVPAGQTEFARDVTFGYRHSNLRKWIEEKTGGRVSARNVVSIPLSLLRDARGSEGVRDRLLGLRPGTFVVVNAAEYGDLEVFVHGMLLAESTGRRFLCRTAASFVRVCAGLEPKPLLDASEIVGAGRGGLVVVGSYTGKTTAQLDALLGRPQTFGLELDVGQLAAVNGERTEIARLRPQIESALRDDRTVVVYTTRARETALGRAGDLSAGRRVTDALVDLVRSIEVRPRFLIAKGGITSSDLAVRALGVRRALVLGQAAAGIPVWKAGGESRWPGLAYVVFPGNVGTPDTLRLLVERLGG